MTRCAVHPFDTTPAPSYPHATQPTHRAGNWTVRTRGANPWSQPRFSMNVRCSGPLVEKRARTREGA